MKIGVDIGSTTLKCVVMDGKKIIFKHYERHYSDISAKTAALLDRIAAETGISECEICVSGSAGMGLAERAGLPFLQEVYATRCAVKEINPLTDAVIELGGEDAKILFLKNEKGADDAEVRMNGTCAGGTGAFIDQMATLLKLTPAELGEKAETAEKKYTIASRCGVFAKSDIQPLINQGAKTEDIAASIFYAVVNQTVGGLAQGRTIGGSVLYLGGPLTFFPYLRKAFDDVLKLKGVCPENSLFYVAEGAALSKAGKTVCLSEIKEKILASPSGSFAGLRPLFKSREEYEEFSERHNRAFMRTDFPYNPAEVYYIGIDAGSTTVKCAVCDSAENIVFTEYIGNSGNPVPAVKAMLEKIYSEFPGIKIGGAAATGYGEDLIKNAFRFDFGVVETVAHLKAAKKFRPDADFILDIGGQDIKCIKLKNGAVDSLYLNEACSSGCGSFLQTFASALGYSAEEFARLGLFAERPAELGSRCTVFMNSAVKQAQKDGAGVENIAAGLSVSVVKNALYKVIRAPSPDALGRNIVVQGGTFYNDSVLRAFELETGREVIRPSLAGLMGAYGAALYAKQNAETLSGVLKKEELEKFTHEVKAIVCGGCQNACRITVNTFDGGRKFIGGNRCDKPVTSVKKDENLNLYAVIRKKLAGYGDVPGKITVGLPLVLNMYELLPFWHTFFKELGFGVKVSPFSTRKLYFSGQNSIPSDTVCYPAKLSHGHIEYLAAQNVDAVFYPCMTYNFDEKLGDNHYNCPVVAYYPEVLKANVPSLNGDVKFIYDYVGLHRPRNFGGKIYKILKKYFPSAGISRRCVRKAAKKSYAEYYRYMEFLRAEGRRITDTAVKNKIPVVILAGRPYHVDPEINHGIDELAVNLGTAVITEDAVSGFQSRFPTNVLNQWTYHARLYAAAKYSLNMPYADLIQLVSFGCGLDAVTSDETRAILENGNKLYTQIKIDEITNLGAVKIRLRSLFEAHNERRRASDEEKQP